MQNKVYVSFTEGQTWFYNLFATVFESSNKTTIQVYEPATFVTEIQNRNVGHTDTIIKQTKWNIVNDLIFFQRDFGNTLAHGHPLHVEGRLSSENRGL